MPSIATEEETYEKVTDLLGGRRVFTNRVKTQLDAHNLIRDGLPSGALQHLVDHFHVLKPANIEKAVGMSIRTYQRIKKGAQNKPLNLEQSGRAWKLAEVLARATQVFGEQEEAEKWLEKPAMGLDGNRPLDLLDTPAGTEMVEDFLTKLEYGVYI